jgi:glutathione S-transferase
MRINVHVYSLYCQQTLFILVTAALGIDELWSDGLQRFGGNFLGGDTFTAVDAFFAPVAIRIQTYGLPLSERSMAYSQRLLALDSMQSWITAGIQEPWTEINHEQEILQSGTLLADYR